MGATVRSVGTAAAVASGNATPGLPAGTSDGDMLVAVAGSKDNINITDAGGYVSFGSPLPSRPSATRNLEILWKQAGPGETATTFTHTGGNSCIMRVVAITAGTWDTADPLGAIAVSTTDRTVPTVTPDIADCLMLMAIMAADDDGSGGSNFATYSSGGLTWTERIDNATTSGTDMSLGAATAPNPGTSATGAGSYTSTSAGVAHCALIAIRPAASGSQNITPDHLASGEQVFAPTLVPGSVTITPDAIASGEQMFAPTLAQVVAPGFVASTAQVFAPALAPGSVTIQPGHIASSEQVFMPTVDGSIVVTPGFVASAALIFAPSLAVGSVTLSPGFLSSTAQVFPPSISGGVEPPASTASRVPSIPTVPTIPTMNR